MVKMPSGLHDLQRLALHGRHPDDLVHPRLHSLNHRVRPLRKTGLGSSDWVNEPQETKRKPVRGRMAARAARLGGGPPVGGLFADV